MRWYYKKFEGNSFIDTMTETAVRPLAVQHKEERE